MYEQIVTIPANTATTNFTTTAINLDAGIISQILITWPWGCAAIGGDYLVGVRLSKNNIVVFPKSGQGWFTGNGNTLKLYPGDPLLKPSYSLNIETYNTDETNQHQITVQIEVQPIWVYYHAAKVFWYDYGRGALR